MDGTIILAKHQNLNIHSGVDTCDDVPMVKFDEELE